MKTSKDKYFAIVSSLLLVSCLPAFAGSQYLVITNHTTNYTISIKKLWMAYGLTSPGDPYETSNPSGFQDIQPGNEGRNSWNSYWISWTSDSNNHPLSATIAFKDKPGKETEKSIVISQMDFQGDQPMIDGVTMQYKQPLSAGSTYKYSDWDLTFTDSAAAKK